jgi:hypothetical protein
MRQRWAHLLFLHWVVPADALAGLLPAGLDLDTYDGQAYVGLIPFTMTGVRPWWAPALPWLSAFHEVNVRTYVHRQGRDPGVWFISLDAASQLAVRLARWRFHLPYYHARMSMTFERERGRADLEPEVIYHSERLGQERLGPGCTLRYRPTGRPAPARPGTLEHFLVERYILYAHAGRSLYEGRVHHASYPLQTAEVHAMDENLVAAAGIRPSSVTPLVHYASEVRVEVFPLEAVSI